MMPGMPERRTHDYGDGITTLFAALNVATGEITGSLHRRHRAVEFKKFLTKLDNIIPDDLDVHLICDNYATHKSPTITSWLARHPRFHMHFTPTYSSWLNQVDLVRPVTAKLHRGTTPACRPWKRTSARGSRLERKPQTVRLDQRRRDTRRVSPHISAIPLSVPLGGVSDERVSSVLRDASPSVILTTSSVVGNVAEYVEPQPGESAPSVVEVDLLDLDSSAGSGAGAARIARARRICSTRPDRPVSRRGS